MRIRQRLSLKVIAALAAVAVVAVFAMSAMAAVGTIKPLPRTVVPVAADQHNAELPIAAASAGLSGNAATSATPGGDPPPTPGYPDDPEATLTPSPAPASFWPGAVWVPPTPPATPTPLPTPTPETTPGFTYVPPSHDPGDGSIAEAPGLVAVLVVGPSGDDANNLVRADEFAAKAAGYGMVVKKLYTPHATWQAVRDAAQGANLLVYWGHGNGWPSPYGSFQEQTKDGFGLNSFDGDTSHTAVFYGAALIRKNITLAPNSVVILSHLCYSAGNAEPGFPIPDWDTAWQRVDNHSAGFLAAGASDVFAYGTGDAVMILDGLFKGDKTMDQIFMTRGRENRPYYGFTGWDDRYQASTRSPNDTMHLDPGQVEGFLRALTGDLAMTSSEWRASAPSQ
jgi:hypothetical protein